LYLLPETGFTISQLYPFLLNKFNREVLTMAHMAGPAPLPYPVPWE
jgi:hypothetical protein